MGAGPTVIVVTLRDGTEVRGEYVGAQEGFMYLATGEHVERFEQRLVIRFANEEAL